MAVGTIYLDTFTDVGTVPIESHIPDVDLLGAFSGPLAAGTGEVVGGVMQPISQSIAKDPGYSARTYNLYQEIRASIVWDVSDGSVFMPFRFNPANSTGYILFFSGSNVLFYRQDGPGSVVSCQ